MSLTLLLWWLLATSAAHVGAPIDAIDVQIDRGHPTALVVEGSVGVFWSTDRDTWRWICHEAVTRADAFTTPRYAVAGSTWLAVVRRLEQSREGDLAVYRSTDQCVWTAVGGLDGHEIEAIALSADGGTAWAVSADEGLNTVFRSDDGGSTFAPTSLADHYGAFTSIVLAEGTAGTTWTASVGIDGRLWVHRSLDGGESWTSHEVVADAPEPGTDLGITVEGAHPDQADVAWIRLDYVGADRVLRTTNGGKSLTEVLATDGEVTDLEVGPAGDVWLGVSGQAFLHADDGTSFAEVEGAPPGLGVRVAGDEVWLATRFELLQSALASGNAADGFDARFSFYEVDGPLECPAGTAGADICEPLYATLQASLGLGGDTGPSDTGQPNATSDEPRPGRCGCGGTGAAALLLLLGSGRTISSFRAAPPRPPRSRAAGKRRASPANHSR